MENLILFGYAVGGVLFHLLMKYRDAITQRAEMNWRIHLINTAFSIVVSALIAFFRDDIKGIIDFEITKLSSFFIGYFSDSIWKNFTKFYGNKYKVEQED